MNTRFTVNGKGVSFLASAAFLLVSGGQAYAANRLVPQQYPTIQAGINAAVNGDTVIVDNGPYSGYYTGLGNKNLNLSGKNITLRPSNESYSLYIDCQGIGRAFYFSTGVTSATVLRGFTIIKGVAPYGGGIVCENGGSPTIVDCTIQNCRATNNGGGGLFVANASPTVTDCTFSQNISANGGGSVFSVGGSPTFDDCNFGSNTALVGGGLATGDSGQTTILNCTFSDNRANTRGGGMFIGYSSATINDSTFVGNSAKQGGGACNAGNSTFTDTYFTSNDASDFGGGLSNESATTALTRCDLYGNTAGGVGGGMASYASTSTIRESEFRNNSAVSGGGMYAKDGTITGDRCEFMSNMASTTGGGATNQGGTMGLTNCLIAQNSAVDGGGLSNLAYVTTQRNANGIPYLKGGSLTVLNCTVTRNTASHAGSGYYGYIDPSAPYLVYNYASFTNCIVWGNSNNTEDMFNTGGSSLVKLSLVGSTRDMTLAPGVLRVDPLFVSTTNYRLKAGSPAINTGYNYYISTGTDLPGNTRIRGGVVDLGAYEY